MTHPLLIINYTLLINLNNAFFAYKLFHFAKNCATINSMNIGLDIVIDDAYTRGIARGIIQYAKKKGNWNLLGSDWMFSSNEEKKLDGIISRIESSEQVQKLQSYQVPIVDTAGALKYSGFFEVHNDEFETGQQAGRYLLSLGFENFAWVGIPDIRWSTYRYEGFLSVISSKTNEIQSCIVGKDLKWWEKLDYELELLCYWLGGLSKPTALFAANDTIGLKITNACTAANIKVPNDIAILGVDNEDILCELANPSLSSIRVDCESIGYNAAELLNNLIHPTGKNFQKIAHKIITPLNIVERESTKMVVAKDPFVEKALNFIKNRAHKGITVNSILKEIPISRRSLEQKFFHETKKTLHQEIIETKVMYSKNLLRETTSALDVIAIESGFGSLQRFHTQFKKIEKMTPGEWRKKT